MNNETAMTNHVLEGHAPSWPRQGIASFTACVILVLAGCSKSSDPQPPPPQAQVPQAPAVVKAEPLGPAARLFDVNMGEPGWSLSRSGWTPVPENNLTHTFKGHAFIANDRVVVSFANRSGFPQVSLQTDAGLQSGSALVPLVGPAPASPSDAAGSYVLPVIVSVRILENTTAAVAVEATFSTGGREVTATYRLTMGQPILEVRPGPAAGRLAIRGYYASAVVPNFFGDDWFRDADKLSPRIGLPAENFFLALRGDSMVMCVWASPNLNVDGIWEAYGEKPTFTDFEVECHPGKPMWLAFVGGVRWGGPTDAEQQGSEQEITMRWRLPFAAKWRIWALDSDSRSWFQPPLFDTGSKRVITRQKVGAGAVTIAADVVKVHRPSSPDPQHPLVKFQPLVFYPLDRNKETPLDVFTPMDVLRNTLGVGPCQYVLDTEGLGSEEAATPEVVAAWLEKWLARPDAADAGKEIKSRLDAMTAHVDRVWDRVVAYDALADLLAKRCGKIRILPAAEAFQVVAIDQTRETKEAKEKVAAVVARLMAAIEKSESPKLAAEDAATLRNAGAAIDRALAECRMALRELKQAARAVEWDEKVMAGEKELVREIRAQVEEALNPPRPQKKP
jgi:hypothetical protein